MSSNHTASLVAKHLAKWHKININQKHPQFFENLENWLEILESKISPASQRKLNESGYSFDKLQTEYQSLKAKIQNVNSQVVFCHNDLQVGNIIYNKQKDSVSFIDYEYASVSFRGFDIANHFCEFAGSECDWDNYPSKEFQLQWLLHYLLELKEQSCESLLDDDSPNSINEQVKELYNEVQVFSLASHFMWAIWALVSIINLDSI